MKKAIITISGGIDSTTCVAIAKERGYELHFLTVNYGQKNIDRELANTNFFADYFNAVFKKIFIGSEAGPWICPDNSPEFIRMMNQLIQIAVKNNPKVCIEAPLNYMDKQDIIKTALKYGVPLEHTWTCVSNGDKPCGICQPCRNRKEAFESIGLKDPAYLV